MEFVLERPVLVLNRCVAAGAHLLGKASVKASLLRPCPSGANRGGMSLPNPRYRILGGVLRWAKGIGGGLSWSTP